MRNGTARSLYVSLIALTVMSPRSTPVVAVVRTSTLLKVSSAWFHTHTPFCVSVHSYWCAVNVAAQMPAEISTPFCWVQTQPWYPWVLWSFWF